MRARLRGGAHVHPEQGGAQGAAVAVERDQGAGGGVEAEGGDLAGRHGALGQAVAHGGAEGATTTGRGPARPSRGAGRRWDRARAALARRWPARSKMAARTLSVPPSIAITYGGDEARFMAFLTYRAAPVLASNICTRSVLIIRRRFSLGTRRSDGGVTTNMV